jgi:hypothetical protein
VGFGVWSWKGCLCCIRFLREVDGMILCVFLNVNVIEHHVVRVFDIISTFWSGGGRLIRLDG